MFSVPPKARLSSAARKKSSGGGGDPYFSDVGLLLHMDGSNGSAVFTDSSSTPKTVTTYGSGALSTTQKKFGPTSAYFNGVSSYFKVLSYGTAFTSMDFTVEMWFYVVSFPNSYCLLWATDNTNITNAHYMVIDNTGQAAFELYHTDGTRPNSTISGVTTGTWHHIAAVKSGNTRKIFLNGVPGSTLTGSYSGPASVQPLAFCRNDPEMNTNGGIIGYIDEVRITNNVARYSGAFTPPTAAFPDS